MHYFAYLDEFGHIGPYISRHDPKYNTSPIFGLGGLVLPSSAVRQFSSFFFHVKCELCAEELEAANTPAYRWEMKGASVYRPKNVHKYPALRRRTNRIFNQIKNCGGFVFYVGIVKYKSPEESCAEKLYSTVLKKSVKRLDEFCEQRNSTFSIVLDQSGDFEANDSIRNTVVSTASYEMFGENHRRRLIEPPMQVESHLFQTIQCADWLCSLIGKLEAFNVSPNDYPDNECFHKYFAERLKCCSKSSSIRKQIPNTKT